MALEASTIALNDPSLLHEQAYIDGEWCDADDGATFEVTDPATGQALGRVPRMGAAETRRAIEAANDTPYGLAAYMYSRDVGRVFRVSEQLECGILGINTGFISVEVAPFGGVKESGIGREGSKYGVDDWIETRYLPLGGIE
jgi:acyl-CoA reductase-like NAD-dependent aldehyde dehydrogenase